MLDGRNRRLATGTGALDPYFNLSYAAPPGRTGASLRGLLRGERRALAGSLETDAPRRVPADRIAAKIGKSYNRVVESGLYMHYGPGCAPSAFSFSAFRHHRSIPYTATKTHQRLSLTPFLPATVFRGPFRVRALLCVHWPLTGRPLRCRIPL